MKLEIKNLSKNYGKIQALKNVSLTLSPGIYGLLGPNGAGKSTLINLLTDNVKRESGEIHFDGQEILKMGKEYRAILGYMPQQQGCYEDFSAGAFLMYICKLKGLSKKESLKKIDEILSVVNLSEYRNERIGGFSGGMKQRLLLAQSLLNDPKILILDEPTAGVDPQERINIRNFISEIASDKIVLLATHIVSDVEAVAKEIVLMKHGEIIGQGTPYKLIKDIQANVYEIKVEQERLYDIQSNYAVSNLRHTEQGLVAKIIAKEPPSNVIFEKAQANLEDVYLYHFN
ncbi:MAG: ABC transporter ATP-binding protein [Lachnospiraceae bacterium]|nr:ABC transporter ATP-binding protein [Lachnospiraceae bacterium]